MCGVLEQETFESRGKPKNEAGGTQAIEDAGEGYSRARSVEALVYVGCGQHYVGCGQHSNNREDSSPLAWGWVPRDSPPPGEDGGGRLARAGPAGEGDGVQQASYQPPTGPPLAESSGGRGRGTPKGTGSVSMNQRVTSVNQFCRRRMVVDPAVARKGPSDSSDSCENGIDFAKSVALNERPKVPNCDESSETAGERWWHSKTPSCEAAIGDPSCGGSGVVSVMFRGFCLSFKTKASFEIMHCGAVGPQQKVDPGTGEANGQHRSKITPRSETWREKRGDTFTGGRCRSTQIQHGRHTPPGSPRWWSAEESSAPSTAPEVCGRGALARSPDQRSGQAAIRHGSIQAGNRSGSVFSATPCRSETLCRMYNYSTRWSRYQIRRDIRRENPSLLRLGRRMTEPAVRRQAARAVHDFRIAFARVQEGIRAWNNREARTFANYMIYTDAADVTVDKMRYAEALLSHYAEVRIGNHGEREYEDGLREFINDNLGPSANSVNDWFTTTREYAAEQWRLEDAADDLAAEAEAAAGADHNGGEMIANNNEAEAAAGADHNDGEMITDDNEDEEDDGANADPADTPNAPVPSPRSPNVPAPSAEDDDGEMVTDKDIEDILDAVEDEDVEADDGKSTTDKPVKPAEAEATTEKEKKMVDAEDEKKTENIVTGSANMDAEDEKKELAVAKDGKTTTGSQEHLLPYCLSLLDGAAQLPIWFRKVRTYFLVNNLSKETPDRQWAALADLVDDDMKKLLHHEMKIYRSQTNLENMCAALQRIFDEVYPRCVRCGETEDYQHDPHDLENSNCLAGEANEDDKKEKKMVDAEDEKKTENTATGSVNMDA